MEDLSKLCRLCMKPLESKETMSIFENQEKSYSMKIITCFSIEVCKTDKLPKQMCTPCVYWLEKTYIFRKQCRKSDTKFRSFLRKVKNKKIHRLDELSDTEDEENGSEDMDLAFVQDYDRKVLDAKVKEQLDVKVKEQLDAQVKEQLDAKLKERAITERKILVSQIKRGLFEALDNLDEEETGTVEVAAVPTSSFLADLQLDVEVEEEIEQEEVEMEEEEVREQVILAPSPPRKKLAPRQANKKKNMSPVKVEVLPSDSEISVVEEEAVDGNIKEEDQEQGDVGETETTAVIMRSGLIHSCRDCNRKFHTAGELVKHSKLHKSSKNNCDDCGKCFSSSGSLFRHQKIHRDEKQHKCDVCGKSFTQKGSLLRHAVVHNENGERPFACDDCDKSFSQRHLLTLHVTKAHSDLAVTFLFRCNECPKTFRHSSGLSRHALTHSGKRYPCTVCNQTLSDYSALKRHTKALHCGGGVKGKKRADH